MLKRVIAGVAFAVMIASSAMAEGTWADGVNYASGPAASFSSANEPFRISDLDASSWHDNVGTERHPNISLSEIY